MSNFWPSREAAVKLEELSLKRGLLKQCWNEKTKVVVCMSLREVVVEAEG